MRLIDTLLQSASDRTFIAEYSSMQMQVNNIWALISRPDINEQSKHSPQSEEDQWNILTKRYFDFMRCAIENQPLQVRVVTLISI